MGVGATDRGSGTVRGSRSGGTEDVEREDKIDEGFCMDVRRVRE